MCAPRWWKRLADMPFAGGAAIYQKQVLGQVKLSISSNDSQYLLNAPSLQGPVFISLQLYKSHMQ